MCLEEFPVLRGVRCIAVRLLPNSTARGSAARASRRWSTVARTCSGKASRGGRPRPISPSRAKVPVSVCGCCRDMPLQGWIGQQCLGPTAGPEPAEPGPSGRPDGAAGAGHGSSRRGRRAWSAAVPPSLRHRYGLRWDRCWCRGRRSHEVRCGWWLPSMVLALGRQAEPLLPQQAGDGVGADTVPGPGQLARQRAGGLHRPPQRRHRITPHIRLNQRQQCRPQPRIQIRDPPTGPRPDAAPAPEAPHRP